MYQELKQDGTFDLVVGNPPYVAEANNKPLFEHLRSVPAWRGTYRGKTDYLYYFLLLAVEKLRPGGDLCVIVPAGWMNAGNADFLRERLASELTLRELYLFGSYRLFASDQGPAPTPTVESAILVATKGPAPKGHKLRVVALEDERLLADRSRADLLAEMARRSRRSGRRGGVLSHLLPQALLEADYPWPVKFPGDGIHMRAVSHLLTALEDHSTAVEIMSRLGRYSLAWRRRLMRTRRGSARHCRRMYDGPWTKPEPWLELRSWSSRAPSRRPAPGRRTRIWWPGLPSPRRSSTGQWTSST